MHWHNEITLKLPSPHEDEPRNLRQDILDELEDHLQCAMQRELRQTNDAQAARRRVINRFGNPATIARRLWLDAMKGTLMNQRIMLCTNVLLVLIMITLCVIVLVALRDAAQSQDALRGQLLEAMADLKLEQRHSQQSATSLSPEGENATADRRNTIVSRLAGLSDNWREAFAVGGQLLALPPDEGIEILRENWNRIRSTSARQQIIKAFAFSAMSQMHPRIIDVMHLGMTDDSPDVQSWAIGYLKWMAFRDFALDFDSYEQWYAEHSALAANEAIIASMSDWSKRLRERDEGALAVLTEINFLAIRDQQWLRDAARQSDLPAILAELIERGSDPRADATSREHARGAIRRLVELQPDETLLRRLVLPIIDNPSQNDELLSDAIRALGGPHNAWARDIILNQLQQVVRSNNRRVAGQVFTMAQTLASYNDPSIIPALIELIESDNTYDTVYGIGYFALHPLTGVAYDESHDGAWWRQWWESNQHRFDEVGQDADEAQVTGADATNNAIDAHSASDEADSNSEGALNIATQNAGQDENKQYFLIGGCGGEGNVPESGCRLLLVLPGGDGSSDFHPFVRNIHGRALGDEWLVAQLIAPVWDEHQMKTVVWPTRGLPWQGMKFSTEEFIAAVIADVVSKRAIDKQHLYALGWSSGGPAVYATAMAEDSPLTGAFVAMSVFHERSMPDVRELTTKRYYILHSPDDFIQMRFPESARDTLSELGATVHMETYEGGHGWHGDVFGMIRRGVNWLVEQSDENPIVDEE